MVYSAHLVADDAPNKPRSGERRQSLPYEFLEPNIPSQLDTDFIVADQVARERNGAHPAIGAQPSDEPRPRDSGRRDDRRCRGRRRVAGRTRRARRCRPMSSCSTRSSSAARRSTREPCSEKESSKIFLIRSMRLGADHDRFRHRAFARAGALAFRSDRTKGHRPAAADPRYFCPAGAVARRQAAGRARAAKISAAAARDRARTRHFRGLPAASADAGRAKRSSRPTAAAFATVSRSSKNRSTIWAASGRNGERPRAKTSADHLARRLHERRQIDAAECADAERSLRREERCSRRSIRHRGGCVCRTIRK